MRGGGFTSVDTYNKASWDVLRVFWYRKHSFYTSEKNSTTSLQRDDNCRGCNTNPAWRNVHFQFTRFGLMSKESPTHVIIEQLATHKSKKSLLKERFGFKWQRSHCVWGGGGTKPFQSTELWECMRLSSPWTRWEHTKCKSYQTLRISYLRRINITRCDHMCKFF